MSEFAPATQPAQQNFPRRNRTISGLSDAIVVVRAALQSGALITAAHAKTQGRTIYAVPGDTGNPMAAGPNELLRKEEAFAATSALDVLNHLRWPVPEELLEAPVDEAKREVDPGFPSGKQEPVKPVTDHEVIDEESLRLWRLLDDRTPAHVDDLSLRAQLPVQVALRKLADLELKGMVIQRPGKYFLKK